jgi:2-keto-3-deoxy-L-rhamnonate aldolase RhmA
VSDFPHARFRERLARREPLFGVVVSLPSPELAEMLAAAGFDWLFIDMEHGLLDFAAVQRLIQAVAGACPCIVRVPNNEAILVAKALDTGAAGIVVPHVNDVAQARAAVQAARYPPVGARSIGAARAQGYGERLADAIAHDNERVLVVAQAEHVDAVAAIDEIVAVPGVDAIFIGPFDLSASMGKPGEIHAPEVQRAIATVTSACAAASVPCGIFATDGPSARRAGAAGLSLVCIGTDTLMISSAAKRLLGDARAAGVGGNA